VCVCVYFCLLCAVALNNNIRFTFCFIFFACARHAETESDGGEETAREIRTRHEHRKPVAHGGDGRCGATIIPGSEVVRRRRRFETNHHQTAGRGECVCDDKRRPSNKPDDDIKNIAILNIYYTIIEF